MPYLTSKSKVVGTPNLACGLVFLEKLVLRAIFFENFFHFYNDLTGGLIFVQRFVIF